MGCLDAVLCSPPWADQHPNHTEDASWHQRRDSIGPHNSLGRCQDYGTHPGQLGALKAGEPPVTTTASGVPVQTWAGCYDSSWKDILFPKAFAHPAKMARGLLERILDFGLAEGFWDKESILGDCFGGVGTTGILCSYKGIRSVSVELEPRFYGLSMATRRLHRHKLARLGCPLPVYLRGDSRHFAALVGQCGAAITSPPYATGDTAGPESLARRQDEAAARMLAAQRWGTGGQTTDGNLAALTGIVTSPPWADSLSGKGACPELRPDGSAFGQGRSIDLASYGTTAGNLGNNKPETYWTAVMEIYQQVRLALKPGGVLAVVVKSFVKDKAIVDLPGQTAQLLTRLDFTVFLEVHASLTHEETHPGLFGSMTKKREKKSFFRRLAEKKGSPPIDHETVLFCRSPP